jgi:CubicO group peptidase (beta-lactamase class C family)
MRFFGPQTLSKILPRTLTDLLGPDTTKEYGIGTMPFRGEGLGEGTFAHGAASSATLRIDPVNKLVIAMTRNQAGKNFREYHLKFIAAIADLVAR